MKIRKEIKALVVIKRDCTEVNFDKSKISNAILKAMKNGSGIIKPKIADSEREEAKIIDYNQLIDYVLQNMEVIDLDK